MFPSSGLSLGVSFSVQISNELAVSFVFKIDYRLDETVLFSQISKLINRPINPLLPR
jgi:hypothetical protein